MVETVLDDGGYTLSGKKGTYYGNDLTSVRERRQEHTELRQEDGGQAFHWGQTFHWELEEEG